MSDRRFLLVFAGYWLLGFVSNAVRTSSTASASLRNAVALVTLLALIGLIVFLGDSVRRRRYRGSDLGFTIDTPRALVLVALTAVYAAFALFRLPLVGFDHPIFLARAVLAVIVEEILFRPLLIGVLRRIFAATHRPVLWAVVLAALCWAAGHLPSKPFAQVIGIFAGGLMFGALYVFSGSNVVGFVVHADANAGSVGALVTFGFYLALAALLRERPATS